jgi:hypothetical protein
VPFSTVMYMKGDVAQAVCEVGQLCQRLGYSGWSLQGDPFALNYSQKSLAARICILQQQILDKHDIHLDSAIGTVHLIHVVENRVRIAARAELLDGRPVRPELEERLKEFSLWLGTQLTSRGLKASSRDLGLPGARATVPLTPPDTGSLRR